MQLRPEGHSRGQVIIVAALVIAAIFVGLALVLNSGIYAENLSSRETTDTEGALSFTLATDETIAEAYERTNSADKSSASGAETTFNNTMESWESAQQRRGAMQGIGIDVEHTAHVGWRLEQDTDRQFMPAGETTTNSWTVADGTGNVSAFQLNVTRASLYDAAEGLNQTSNGAYRLNISDGTTDWELYIFQDSANGRVIVHVGNPDGEYSDIDDLISEGPACEAATDRVTINLRNQSLSGDGISTVDCPPLRFEDDLENSVSIRYENTYNGSGASIEGLYTLVVNGSEVAEKSNFNVSNDPAPTAQAVVYSVSYASHYEKADMSYERRGTYAVREETYAS